MRYFHRAHGNPDAVLDFADRFFGGRGFTPQRGQGDHARYTGSVGTVDLHVEIEGGHFTRVNVATPDVGESQIDKRVKRFLSELHRMDEPAHVVRGDY